MTGRRLLLALLGVLSLAAAAVAQQGPRPAAVAAAPRASGQHALTATDLGAWLDGFMAATLEQGKIAAAQVVVVDDGEVLFKRGYGYADVAAETPMDPDRHQMRIGSTSKLFVWTAVMQLVEAGKIDLDADVNRYLDFRISPRGDRPVTMADLMTHRGGFEEGLKDVMATDPKFLKTNERYLKENMRPFMFAPGEVPAYSNYGTALAGYIVQRVSGESYEAYVERHILAPLSMRSTTARQPLPPAFAETAAKGYRTSETPPSPFELVGTAPAGQISATAADMANFMLAHLQDGRFGDARILRPETARLMHSPSLRAPAGFDTLAHGFFRGKRNGRIVLGHGGDTVVFHSDLNLLPEEGVGIFVSFNSRGENDAVYGARERLFQLFLDRYFAAPVPVTPPAIATATGDAGAIAGSYESSRRVETGFISLFYLLQQDQIVAHEDGTISASWVPGERFREIAPGLWREVAGTRQLLAVQSGGRPAIVDSRNPVAILQAAPTSRSGVVFQLVTGLSLLVLLCAAITWPIAAWVRYSRRLGPLATGCEARVRRLTRIAVVANLIYLLAWYSVLAPILRTDVSYYNGGLDSFIRFLQVAAIVPLLGAILGLVNAWLALRAKLNWAARARSFVVALALIGFLWVAWMAGFIGWSLNY
ncbi:serine hydrolase domain-containing protein [Sphingomonas sp. M1-B02]|uniref:serine hydrolase domain-containing protein n=1 Tax=Sphingomonas sp. M1-B02 TaxID=3114300 RepID=UPI00223FCDD0|nr:serine hydrolase domain-containing protein [Sphingomonas sp. S6-11]UZK66707.1 beta-lactamase family protein [Sphingomonas sp. S6-11]